jgi:hypothetical protein
MNQIISYTAFSILALLWLGFLVALAFNRCLLDKCWTSFRRLPLLIQLLIALLVLPVVAGLWSWQFRWPVWLRLVLVLGLAWMTVSTFFPRLPLA